MTFDDESNKTLYDDSDMTSYEWWNTWETIDYEWNETHGMTSYGDLGVPDYEIIDFYDQTNGMTSNGDLGVPDYEIVDFYDQTNGMTSNGDLGVPDYEIVDFYDQTTVSNVS